MNMHYTPEPKLSDVLAIVMGHTGIQSAKRTAMVSALHSLEKWTGRSLKEVPANVPALAELCSTVQPSAADITPKTLANVKSLCLSALAESETVPGLLQTTRRRSPKSPEWAALWNKLRLPVQKNNLSRLVNWCSRAGIKPQEVNSDVIERVMTDMQRTSLRPNQYKVHRAMAKMWNEIVDLFPEKRLQKVDVPVSRLRRTRVPTSEFPESFFNDWNAFAAWANGNDIFAQNGRPTPLKQTTLDGYFRRMHLAASTLVQTGVPTSSIRSLADLVTVDAYKRILRQRHEVAKGQPTYENFFLSRTLIQMARDWVKVDIDTLSELKRLATRVPAPIFQMTRKNKLLVLQFDDPTLQKRFLTAPDRIWHDVQTGAKHNRLQLAQAQAALGLGILMRMPVRLGNLTALAFDEHLFLRSNGTSTFMLSAEETKTGASVEFDIPVDLAKQLLEYRDVIAPAVIGYKPKHLFSNVDGSLKGFAGVRYLIQRYLKQYVGIHMNPHAFRHLAAKFILDSTPGAHVLVQHLLGHKKVETTATYYAGLDTRRAGRHHHALLTKALNERDADKPSSTNKRRGR